MTNPADMDLMADGKGGFTPRANIPASRLLEDQMVNLIAARYLEMNATITALRNSTQGDVEAFLGCLHEKYGVTKGGPGGNVEFKSFNELVKLERSVGKSISFGPELESAKALIDECVNDWSEGTRNELRTLVQHAFKTDNSGRVNTAAILSLKKHEFDDARWKRAMEAISDAERVVSSKEYYRVHVRAKATDGWTMVPISIAGIGAELKDAIPEHLKPDEEA